MKARIICRGLAGRAIEDPAARVPVGQYLAAYTPEANGGWGDAAWTADPRQALLFTDAAAAFECWKQVPANRPVRGDGKPNRPLTVFHVEIEPVTE